MSLPHDRCSLHPQRRVVGICPHCLRERLTGLIDSITPTEDVFNGEEDAEQKELTLRLSIDAGKDQTSTQAQLLREPSLTQEISSRSNLQSSMKASAEIGIRTHANLEDSLNSAFQKVKHAHQQLSFVAQSPYQGAIKVAPAASPLFSNAVAGSRDKQASLSTSRRRSNASESDMKSFHGGSGKKKVPWFSISKGKNSLVSSPLPQGAGAQDEKHLAHKLPQVTIYAGRKSASDAIAGSCNNYRQAYMAGLEAIAEINIGEAAIKVDRNEGNADAHGNSSWLSSLFHRRKGSRYKGDTQQHAGDNNTQAPSAKTCASIHQTPKVSIDAGRPSAKTCASIHQTPKVSIDAGRPSAKTCASIHQTPKVSIDAGRLSLDGAARPTNFKQILRKMEARSNHQRVDCSPSPSAENARKQGNGSNEGMGATQKRKAIASARSSISVDMPVKQVGRASPVPTMRRENANREMDGDNGDADRARSRGRAWNRTLSPLLGFKNSIDSPHQRPGFATPDHAIFKNSIALPPQASSYLSPLRRSKRASDTHVYASGTMKTVV